MVIVIERKNINKANITILTVNINYDHLLILVENTQYITERHRVGLRLQDMRRKVLISMFINQFFSIKIIIVIIIIRQFKWYRKKAMPQTRYVYFYPRDASN